MNLTKEQLARHIQLHTHVPRVLANIAADKIIAIDAAFESKPKVAPLQLDEPDARVMHNALIRYHTLLTREHRNTQFNAISNFKYRERVQALADRVRDEVIAKCA